MRKRLGVLTFLVIVAIGIGLWRFREDLFFGLDPDVFDLGPAGFAYQVHTAPRVFAYHLPIHASPLTQPDPGVHVFVEPELGEGVEVEEVVIEVMLTVGGEMMTVDCMVDEPGRWVCPFEPAAGLNRPSYSARVRGSDGQWIETIGTYQTQTGTPSGTPAVFPLRVPIAAGGEAIDHRHRIDVLLLWDPTGGYPSRHFFRDVGRELNETLLSDPVYRWRDVQLAFWTYTQPGFTRGYYSPRSTRCGQNPFLGDWPAALDFIDVVGVIHRKEESGAPAGTDPKRDCAGRAVFASEVGTFSARGDVSLVLKHEFGHAAFGLGDEYDESSATAAVPGEPRVENRQACCCRKVEGDSGGGDGGTTGGGGTTSGGGGVEGVDLPGIGGDGPMDPGVTELLECSEGDPGSPPDPLEVVNSMPFCDDPAFERDADCGVESSIDGFCPSKTASCVLEAAFLGGGRPADAARLNRFPSAEACEAARTLALAHPGIEDAASGLGDCRPLCGGTQPPCACAPGAEAWYVDLDPAVPESPRDDVMDSPTASDAALGTTCAWCVETSLCVRWQRALGDSVEVAWVRCGNPG